MGVILPHGVPGLLIPWPSSLERLHCTLQTRVASLFSLMERRSAQSRMPACIQAVPLNGIRKRQAIANADMTSHCISYLPVSRPTFSTRAAYVDKGVQLISRITAPIKVTTSLIRRFLERSRKSAYSPDLSCFSYSLSIVLLIDLLWCVCSTNPP